MTTKPTFGQQLLRRKPIVLRDPNAHDGLARNISTFQLASFGIGATIGTGIFFVMADAVPAAGPAVIISFIFAGIAAGLAAICYAELASAVPVSGSTYSYAYATLGEFAAMLVAGCLLLEYGVSTAAVAVGWSGYLNQLLDNLHLPTIPQVLSAAPWDENPGWFNLPAVVLVALCAVLLIRGASESAKVNATMVIIKIGVLLFFCAIAFTAFHGSNFEPFNPNGFHGIQAAAALVFFSFIGLDAVSTAGEEVKNPQKQLPIALIGALITVIVMYVLVAVAAIGAQKWTEFEGQSEAGLARILINVTGHTWPSIVLSAGAVISIFSVTLVTLYGQTRILFAMGRDKMLPTFFTKVSPKTQTPVNNTILVSIIVSILAAFVPIGKLMDMVSIGTLVAFMVVALGVIILRVREPNLPRGFKVPGYPVTPILAIIACLWILKGIHWYTWIAFGAWVGVVLVFYLVWGRKNSALENDTPKETV